MKLFRLKTKKIWNKITAVLVFNLFLVPAIASAQTVTQSYGTTGTVQQGMVVMLDPSNASNVTPLSSTNAKKMLGVAVSGSDTPVTLSGGASGTPTYVSTTGKQSVLVSTQNGPIKSGDTISISALDGIAMKSDNSQPVLLGKALGDFSQSTTGTSQAQLKTSNGTRNVVIGIMPVSVNITINPTAKGGAGTNVPSSLQKVATAIAGKPVSAARIYLSLAILVLSLLIVGSLLYSSVRTSLTAIGRNPLARASVLKGMFQVLLVGVIIVAVGIAAVFVLVRS